MGCATLRSGHRGLVGERTSRRQALTRARCAWRPRLRLTARALDLRGVVVRVRCVDAKPVLGAVGAAYRVRADDLPIVVGHSLEELFGCLARPAHRFERGLDWTVCRQSLSKSFLVVAMDHRLGLDEEPPDPERGHHLAVAQVMGDLAWRPATVGRPIELVFRHVLQRLDDRAVAVAVLVDQPFTLWFA